MPAQPSNGFFTHWPSPSKNLLGQNQCVFEISTLTLYFVFHHGKKDVYISLSHLNFSFFYYNIHLSTYRGEEPGNPISILWKNGK